MSFLLALFGVVAAAAGGWALIERRRLRVCLEAQAAGADRAYLERLFETSPEAIVVADNASRVIRVNGAFVRMFGYTREEAVGQCLDELLAPPALRDEAGSATSTVAGGGNVSFETVRLRKDGTELHVSILGTPITVEGGQVAVYGIYRDITELVQTVEALSASELKFSMAFRSSPGPATISTLADGRLIEVNDAFVEITGYARDEVIGCTTRDLGLWVDPRVRDRAVEALESRGAVRNLEYTFRTKSGECRTGLFSADLVELDGDRCMLALTNDITERKRAIEALEESEGRYALAARGANDGLWDWNLESGKVYYSPRWRSMLGYSNAEVTDIPEDWFRRVHPKDVERLKAEITKHLERPSPHVENEHRVLHKDGTYRWMLCRGVAERSGIGKAVRMAGSLTDITDRKRAEERLIHDAFHDVLTGLPNRALFTNLLERSIARLRRRAEYRFAVLFLDIDRFKVVNDSLGHMVGDQLLMAVARRLAACLRPGDTVARLGGDEFTILLDDIDDDQDAIRIAERVQSELRTPFKIGTHEVFTSASMGIALSGIGYRRPEEVLRDADTAMYRAKSQGRACHEVFDTDMHQHAVSVLKLETDLRRALDRDEFRMVYQPIVALRTGQLAGFEALIRWDHPERGLVVPTEFIQLAEETGLIIPIGQWALWEACRQVNVWLGLPRNGHPLTVSVNLSARQFAERTLVESVADALSVTGLPAESLKLEITESVLMDHAEASVELLDELKESGVQVQVDDFGTGYSSLGYLHRFSLDALKIDQSFVARVGQDIENTEIVRTIVTLARNLGMSVVAEGVETAEQRAYLESLDCEHVQGFLFSGPLDEDEAVELVKSGRSW